MGGLTAGYLLRRLAIFFLTVWLGMTLMFFLPRLAPGDPTQVILGRLQERGVYSQGGAELIQSYRHRFGLDQPLFGQYLHYLRRTAAFDFGYSLTAFPTRVSSMVGAALPWTIGLLTIATVVSFLLGILLGAVLGWRSTSRVTRGVLSLSLVFTAIPYYLFGIALIYVFGFLLPWLPTSGGYDVTVPTGPTWSYFSGVATHGVLPALSIVVTSFGFWALGMRGMMITIEGEDYMMLAQAKGLSPKRILWTYAVRNAILPQITALTLSLAGIVSGAVLVEVVFGYPGVGYLLYWSIINNDYTLLQGIAFILILATALAVLILDLIYPILDPRIRAGRR